MKLFVLYALLLITAFGSGAGLWYEHEQTVNLRAVVEIQSKQLSDFKVKQTRFDTVVKHNDSVFDENFQKVAKAINSIMSAIQGLDSESPAKDTKDKL